MGSNFTSMLDGVEGLHTLPTKALYAPFRLYNSLQKKTLSYSSLSKCLLKVYAETLSNVLT